jgi:hypothetical protein
MLPVDICGELDILPVSLWSFCVICKSVLMIAEFCKVLLTLYYISHLSCQRQLTTKWKLGFTKFTSTHFTSESTGESTDEFGLCTPVYTNGWGDLCTRDLASGVICIQPINVEFWNSGLALLARSSSHPFVYLRRCRTCRVGSLFNRSMLKYVHNLKYLSKYHSKIFKL